MLETVLRRVAVAAVAALGLLMACHSVIAADNVPMPREFKKSQSAVIGQQRLRYTVIAGETFLTDGNGAPQASLFSFSYMKDAPDAERVSRPVLFCFNGGPGSSSVWLHLGTFGPRRMRMPDAVHPPTTPPFELEDNPHWILDVADVVMIDPIGTGFSRVLGSGKLEQFVGQEADALATTQFIETWLRKHGRWSSPKFLVGESYGTIRAARVAKLLMGGATSSAGRLSAITLDGIVLLGQGIVLPTDAELNYVLLLPSYAASAWYHGKIDRRERSLDEWVKQAQEFANQDYRSALFAGDRLDVAERNRIARAMASLIGVPEQELLERNLRIDMNDFRRLLLKSDGLEIGAYDARYTLPARRSEPVDVVGDDPAMGQYTPVFAGAINSYLRGELGVSIDDRYELISFDVFNKWQAPGKAALASSPAQDLETAMRRNQRLRVFVGTGHFDLVTTAGNADYQFAHMGLPQPRVTLRTYASGHMPYLGDESARQLANDLRKFIVGAN